MIAVQFQLFAFFPFSIFFVSLVRSLYSAVFLFSIFTRPPSRHRRCLLFSPFNCVLFNCIRNKNGYRLCWAQCVSIQCRLWTHKVWKWNAIDKEDKYTQWMSEAYKTETANPICLDHLLQFAFCAYHFSGETFSKLFTKTRSDWLLLGLQFKWDANGKIARIILRLEFSFKPYLLGHLFAFTTVDAHHKPCHHRFVQWKAVLVSP